MVEREDSVPLCGTDPGLASATKFPETATPGGLPRLEGKQRLLLQESRVEKLEEREEALRIERELDLAFLDAQRKLCDGKGQQGAGHRLFPVLPSRGLLE